MSSDLDNIRTIDILDEETGNWVIFGFNGLKQGMIFRIYEPDGSLFEDSLGNSIFRAKSDTYIGEDKHYNVDIDIINI